MGLDQPQTPVGHAGLMWDGARSVRGPLSPAQGDNGAPGEAWLAEPQHRPTPPPETRLAAGGWAGGAHGAGGAGGEETTAMAGGNVGLLEPGPGPASHAVSPAATGGTGTGEEEPGTAASIGSPITRSLTGGAAHPAQGAMDCSHLRPSIISAGVVAGTKTEMASPGEESAVSPPLDRHSSAPSPSAG